MLYLYDIYDYNTITAFLLRPLYVCIFWNLFFCSSIYLLYVLRLICAVRSGDEYQCIVQMI